MQATQLAKSIATNYIKVDICHIAYRLDFYNFLPPTQYDTIFTARASRIENCSAYKILFFICVNVAN